ncbi:thioesterase II family protein [Streptomyces triticirhizae]|uniref:Thioesterase n=1 Tax=Streptomyces triticirhizae TaxID=2483353 RepID=A0A3M2L959_9ACTN|nr:alpha/beta fold hydrolase [Streptomyces triticirhizae]RMI32445.1 thioesterase [Streptomyces triticirhizae]
MSDLRTASTTDSDWVRRYHPSARPAVRLVCFPHAGGSASYFHGVSAALAPDVEVLAVQYPGRQDRRAERPLRSVEELARGAVAALRPWAEAGPLAFFGHSMGSMVAFEAAVSLTRAGLAPRLLFLSGRRAPSRVREENVRLRDDAGIMAELRELGGTEAALLDDDELREMILPALRADYHAVETYGPRSGPAVACPIVALVGDDDPRTTVEEARAWADHTSGPFDLRVFPGGHFYLNARVGAVLEAINSRLLPAG